MVRRTITLLGLLLLLPLGQAQRQIPRDYKARDSDLAVKVTLNGELVKFPGTPPIMEGGSVFVPLRGVFERLGANVEWRQGERVVVATKDTLTVSLPVEKRYATINGEEVKLEQPAMVVEGRVVVPLRFLAQSLGAKVDWLKAERTVSIQTEAEEPN